MRKYIILIFAALAAASCNLDYFPYDKVSSGSMQNVSSAATATDGNYALFKAPVEYSGFYTVGNTYIRHYMLMAELKGDNILMSAKSTDPLFLDAVLEDSSSDTNVEYFWFISYKIAYSTSVVINMIDDDAEDAELRHIKGENLVMRAIAHMNLCHFFSNPYVWDNGASEGVVINVGGGETSVSKASVAKVYEQVEKDLLNAIRCMDGGTRRGNRGYMDKSTAQGFLARLYLYMGRDEDCIRVVDEMLAGAEPSSMLDEDYEHLFQFSRESREVLWCVGMIDNTTDIAGEQGVLGSMYWSNGDPGDGSGWAEIYWSQPLIDLYERHHGDLRMQTMRVPKHRSETGKKMIYWPIPTDDGFYENYIDRNPSYDAATGKYTCTYVYTASDGSEKSERHTVETELVNTYPRNYVTIGGQRQYVTVTDSLGCRTGSGGDVYPLNYMKKFSCQDGQITNLSSPIMLRWGELILDRAEAYAHLGDVDKALADVNVMRRRAGLSDEDMFTASNMAARGYDDVLDVVLDERRLELCFEGFRVLDLKRNRRDIDRRYAGRQMWEVVPYNDSRLLYQIPRAETNVSGIQ
ncbi:MAG: RagB/SusD family nutrient uptake outer membrane protein [Clostridium sp.]|nr:RagB/SusD family nutrient uptake outer membrane protein [Bacteroides sp.]MCM1197998.1 RagB/SusD family nutrient uptake outer membrane protein [Clostridium sp.]